MTYWNDRWNWRIRADGRLAVRLSVEPLSVEFEIKVHKVEKPIHIIFRQELDLGGSGGREQ